VLSRELCAPGVHGVHDLAESVTQFGEPYSTRGGTSGYIVWVHHYNHRRPHTACGDQPPASRLHAGVDNVMTNYRQRPALPRGLLADP
jgi:hypothetical protein